MRPLLSATFAGAVPAGALFALEAGWQCRVFVLDDDLFRVLLIPEGGLKEPRTWAIAPGGVDAPWEGRDRFDISGFASPPHRIDRRDDEVVIATKSLAVRVRLKPFGLTWQSAGSTFAQDRPTDA